MMFALESLNVHWTLSNMVLRDASASKNEIRPNFDLMFDQFLPFFASLGVRLHGGHRH